ncbi:PhlD [Streptomyces olivaceiscleroticus]|uniref:3-oxoacyl-[acyl-carrier-protein] synthase III C-terminal domain-containing protein n=1 Tax=Streptomyces olivaceiscleroticus TaxID=68245 RepID=A0ABP3LJ29_9ACTN
MSALTRAHVTRPVIVHPDHWVSTDEILDNIQRYTRQPDGSPHPKYGAWERIIRNTGVERRALCHPLYSPTVSGSTGMVDRNAKVWAAASALAEQAAAQALETAGLQPRDIDAVITSHSTSWAVPNLDIHLIESLKLRPDVRRTALTTLGCIGSAQALAKAAEQAQARPGTRVLVAVAEAISSIYHHGDTSTEAQIYKALFGDSAGAATVTSEPIEPGLAISDSFEYLLPGSRTKSYWGRMSEQGFHFDSSREAVRGPGEAMPALVDWLKQRDMLQPEVMLMHAGGPAILTAVQDGLGLTDEQLAHTRASLRENGNLGGVSVLDVLRRHHTTPPADGASALMLAYGPGFATTALTGHWAA